MFLTILNGKIFHSLQFDIFDNNMNLKSTQDWKIKVDNFNTNILVMYLERKLYS